MYYQQQPQEPGFFSKLFTSVYFFVAAISAFLPLILFLGMCAMCKKIDKDIENEKKRDAVAMIEMKRDQCNLLLSKATEPFAEKSAERAWNRCLASQEKMHDQLERCSEIMDEGVDKEAWERCMDKAWQIGGLKWPPE